MRSSLFIILTVLLLTGCAGKGSVSENQCAAGDWQTIGYRDGVGGYRSTQLLAHQDACMKHDIVPDRAGYMVGWKQGVREYCEPNNGFSVGERGWKHNNVCPSDQRADFLHAYGEGRSLYLARSEVAYLEQTIDQKNARLADVKSGIVSSAAEQLNPLLTPTERINLADRVRRLYEERSQLLADLPELESELAIKTRELDRLNNTLAQATY